MSTTTLLRMSCALRSVVLRFEGVVVTSLIVGPIVSVPPLAAMLIVMSVGSSSKVPV